MWDTDGDGLSGDEHWSGGYGECTAIAHEAELVAPRQNLASLTGAQRMAMVQLREAIETVLKLGPYHPDAVHDLAWIEGDGGDLPFDLCALALGINPDALRTLTRQALARRSWSRVEAARAMAHRVAATINHAPSVAWMASRLRPQLLSVPVSIATAVVDAVIPALSHGGRRLLAALVLRQGITPAELPCTDGEWVDGRAWLCLLGHALAYSGEARELAS